MTEIHVEAVKSTPNGEIGSFRFQAFYSAGRATVTAIPSTPLVAQEQFAAFQTELHRLGSALLEAAQDTRLITWLPQEQR